MANTYVLMWAHYEGKVQLFTEQLLVVHEASPKLKDWLYLLVLAWRPSIDLEAFLQQVLERRLVLRI